MDMDFFNDAAPQESANTQEVTATPSNVDEWAFSEQAASGPVADDPFGFSAPNTESENSSQKPATANVDDIFNSPTSGAESTEEEATPKTQEEAEPKDKAETKVEVAEASPVTEGKPAETKTTPNEQPKGSASSLDDLLMSSEKEDAEEETSPEEQATEPEKVAAEPAATDATAQKKVEEKAEEKPEEKKESGLLHNLDDASAKEADVLQNEVAGTAAEESVMKKFAEEFKTWLQKKDADQEKARAEQFKKAEQWRKDFMSKNAKASDENREKQNKKSAEIKEIFANEDVSVWEKVKKMVDVNKKSSRMHAVISELN